MCIDCVPRNALGRCDWRSTVANTPSSSTCCTHTHTHTHMGIHTHTHALDYTRTGQADTCPFLPRTHSHTHSHHHTVPWLQRESVCVCAVSLPVHWDVHLDLRHTIIHTQPYKQSHVLHTHTVTYTANHTHGHKVPPSQRESVCVCVR